MGTMVETELVSLIEHEHLLIHFTSAGSPEYRLLEDPNFNFYYRSTKYFEIFLTANYYTFFQDYVVCFLFHFFLKV